LCDNRLNIFAEPINALDPKGRGIVYTNDYWLQSNERNFNRYAKLNIMAYNDYGENRWLRKCALYGLVIFLLVL